MTRIELLISGMLMLALLADGTAGTGVAGTLLSVV